MILGKNTHPERQLYYVGSLILEAIQKSSFYESDFFELYGKLKKKEKISMSLFTLALDWLFILELIKLKENQKIQCLFKI